MMALPASNTSRPPIAPAAPPASALAKVLLLDREPRPFPVLKVGCLLLKDCWLLKLVLGRGCWNPPLLVLGRGCWKPPPWFGWKPPLFGRTPELKFPPPPLATCPREALPPRDAPPDEALLNSTGDTASNNKIIVER